MNMFFLLLGKFFRRYAGRSLLLILIIAVLGAPPSPLAANNNPSLAPDTSFLSQPKNILVLFSYHRALWSDNVQNGIASVFAPYQKVNLFYEYMDTKRLKTPEYLATLTKIYTEKYATTHLDVIICVDNNALDLLVDNARSLLPDIPVVFCGINDYKPALHSARPKVTGVVEDGDFSDTLKIAFSARPKATTLYVIGDQTETGRINTRQLLDRLPSVAPDIKTVLMEHMGYEEVAAMLHQADPRQVAFFVSFWKDGRGRNIEPWQLEAVFRKSAIPVFGRSEWMINHGMVGGKCVTGFTQGEAAARLALQILDGTPVAALPVNTNSPNQYLYDYDMLHQYQIDEAVFPDESIGFNRPEPFYRIAKPLGATIVAFSALLLSVIVFLVRNIHRRRLAEAKLLTERQYLTDIIDSLPDPTFIIDTEQCVILWNRAAEAMTGVKREDVLGRGDYAYALPFYGERRPMLIDLLNIRDQEQGRFPCQVRRVADKVYAETFIQQINNGEGAFLWGVAAPLYDRSGRRIGAIEVLKDITALKKSEKANIDLQEQLLQAQKIESIGRLAGGVAHDFNNMLGVILGHAELAQKQVDDTQPLFNNLEEIRKAAQRSADITRQLLAFARKQTIAPQFIDLNESVDGVLAMLRRLIGEDIHLAWLPGTGLGTVMIDPSQLDQILANLFVNARDAIADTGKVTIETDNVTFDEAYCRMHAGYLPGKYVMLAVSDNGCGMDGETLTHMFEPFFTTKEMGKGTGLGLATIYGIVKQNSGFINVYSEPGQGSTFKIYLPRQGKNATPTRREEVVVSLTHDHEVILLVEDEPMILGMATKILELHGYKVLAAATPREALRLAEGYAGEIHLLLTDVVMPEMNGRDLAEKILALYPQIKVLFMSGYTANVIAHQGVLDEGVHFIQKPFAVNNLVGKISKVLGKNG